MQAHARTVAWSTPRWRHAVSAFRVGKTWLFYYLAWRRADGRGGYPQACAVRRRRPVRRTRTMPQQRPVSAYAQGEGAPQRPPFVHGPARQAATGSLFLLDMQQQLDMRNFDVYNSASFP